MRIVYLNHSIKVSGGEIISSVRYAFNAPELSQDPEVIKKVRDEQRKRHVRSRSHLQRQTKFPEQAEPTGRFTDPHDPSTEVGVFEPLPNEQAPIVTIVENVEYFLGQAAGKRRFAKTIRHGLPWRQMLDQFMIMYPEIGDQLGVVFEPMNADLQRLELSCKRTIDKVRQNIEVHYTSSDGEVTVLSRDALQDDALALGDEPESAPAPERTQPSWSQSYPQQPPAVETLPEPAADIVPEEPAEPQVPANQPQSQNVSKPMPSVNFVGKTKNKDRRLLRSSSFTLGSVQDRLIRSANRLDEVGEAIMADKIDILLGKLQEDTG